MFWKASKNSEVNTKSSHSEVFCQKSVLKNFAKFKGKRLCWSPFLIKFIFWRLSAFLERCSSTGVSAFCEFFKILRGAFELFCKTPPGEHLTFFFFLFVNNEVCSLKAIYLVEQRYGKSNSQAHSILCNYGSHAGIPLM